MSCVRGAFGQVEPLGRGTFFRGSPWAGVLFGVLVVGSTALGSAGCNETPAPAFPGIDPAAAEAARKKAKASPAVEVAKHVVAPPQGLSGVDVSPSLRPVAPLPPVAESPLPGATALAKLEGPGAGYSDAVKSGDLSLFSAMDRALTAVYPGTKTEDKEMRIKRSADGIVVLATVISADNRPYAYDIRILYASLEALRASDEILSNVAADVGEALKLVPEQVGLPTSAAIGQLIEGKLVAPKLYPLDGPLGLAVETTREGADRGFISVMIRLVDKAPAAAPRPENRPAADAPK